MVLLHRLAACEQDCFDFLDAGHLAHGDWMRVSCLKMFVLEIIKFFLLQLIISKKIMFFFLMLKL